MLDQRSTLFLLEQETAITNSSMHLPRLSHGTD